LPSKSRSNNPIIRQNRNPHALKTSDPQNGANTYGGSPKRKEGNRKSVQLSQPYDAKNVKKKTRSESGRGRRRLCKKRKDSEKKLFHSKRRAN